MNPLPPQKVHPRFSPFVQLCGIGFLGRLSYEMLSHAHHLALRQAPRRANTSYRLACGGCHHHRNFREISFGQPGGSIWFSEAHAERFIGQSQRSLLISLLVYSWPALLGVRFYHGLSTALYAPAASAQVAKFYPKERGKRLGIYGAAENAGVVLGPVLGGAVLSWNNFSIADNTRFSEADLDLIAHRNAVQLYPALAARLAGR